MEKCRQERQLDADDRFAATIPEDLRRLSLKAKLLAKNKIRNTVFNYQNEVLNQHEHVVIVSLNNVAQCSGFTELLKSISSVMTFINQQPTAGERNYQSL